jgi:hypothetical protein
MQRLVMPMSNRRIEHSRVEVAAEWQCDGKVGFNRLKLALLAAGRKRGRRIYRCKHCRKWHVASRLSKYVRNRRTKEIPARFFAPAMAVMCIE